MFNSIDKKLFFGIGYQYLYNVFNDLDLIMKESEKDKINDVYRWSGY